MYLLQIFLPLIDQNGDRFPRERYEQIERELLARFGGFTAYSRSPADGLWKDDRANLQLDQIVIYQVIAEQMDRSWWSQFRRILEARFAQEEILIWSQVIDIID